LLKPSITRAKIEEAKKGIEFWDELVSGGGV